MRGDDNFTYICYDTVMMTPQQVKKTVSYWQEAAAHDYKTMEVLFESKRYSDTLFYAHIVLEKILKALVESRQESMQSIRIT